jgi:DNA-binding NarL/FixJ family response regulator
MGPTKTVFTLRAVGRRWTEDMIRRVFEAFLPSFLTLHELQVVRVVAAGATNREAAAAALFLSPKTIEFHLGNAYRKLEVRSRTELATLAVRRGRLDASSPDG